MELDKKILNFHYVATQFIPVTLHTEKGCETSQTSKCLFACVPTEGAGDSDSKEHLSYLNMPKITEGISRISDFVSLL